MGRTWMINSEMDEVAYKEGIIDFFDCVYHNLEDKPTIPCPCCRCGNINYYEVPVVKIHLDKYRFSRVYTVWNFHGEDPLENSDMDDDDDDNNMFVSNDNMFVSNDAVVDDDDDDDTLPDENTFVSYDDDFTSKDADVGVDDSQDDIHLDEPDTLLHKLQDSELPLYTNCEKYTKLSAVVKLYNFKGSNG